MRFFRPRGRNDAERIAGTPVDEAKALYEARRYAEAEAASRAVARSRPHNDEYAAVALNIAALATGAQGRHAESLATYDEALAAFSQTFGADHWLTLKLRSDRAQQRISLGQHAECEAECRAVIEAAGRGTGPEWSQLTAAARNGLAFALNAQGRHQEAEALARESLAAYPEHDRGLSSCDSAWLAASMVKPATKRPSPRHAVLKGCTALCPSNSVTQMWAPLNWSLLLPCWDCVAFLTPVVRLRPLTMPAWPRSARTTAAPSKPERCSNVWTALGHKRALLMAEPDHR